MTPPGPVAHNHARVPNRMSCVRRCVLALSGVAALGGSGLQGCLQFDTFACQQDGQCDLGATAGVCIEGHCAHEDETCDSGLRYHQSAPDHLQGECLAPRGSGTGSISGTAETSSGASTDGSGTTGSETTTTTSDTTGEGPGCDVVDCTCSVQVEAGIGHNCALRDDGRVLCWGRNTDGQIGLGNLEHPIAWPQEMVLPADAQVVRIGMGHHHACGVDTQGRAWCWGRNAESQVTPVPRPEPYVTPMLIELDHDAATLALSANHTCFGSGSEPLVTCLGEGSHGELGAPDTTPGPVELTLPTGAPASKLAAGANHTCALVEGSLWCWGQDQVGQLGTGETDDTSAVPTPVPLDGTVIDVVTGRDYTCALVDGGVWCWGHNEHNQMGDGTVVDAHLPVAPALPEGLQVVSLTARNDVTCALTDQSEIYCWGGDDGDVLGLGTGEAEPVPTPLRVEVTDELTEPLQSITVGERHICVVTVGSRSWCWGSDGNEQLGPVDPAPGARAVELDLDCPDP